MIMIAVWNGKVLAQSTETEQVEGNHYFPPESVNEEFLEPSDRRSQCPWKGTAFYYNVTVEGKTIKNAAWKYPSPNPDAAEIEGHIAFYKGVEILANS